MPLPDTGLDEPRKILKIEKKGIFYIQVLKETRKQKRRRKGVSGYL